VRWLAIAAVAAFVSGPVTGAESEGLPAIELVAAANEVRDLTAPPAALIAPLSEIRTTPEIKPVSKPKQVKRNRIKKSILSRTARSQMALLTVPSRPGSSASLDFSDDRDGDSSADELDLHRSFSRPKLSEQDDDEDKDAEISDHVRFRLFLARMKAIEAHKLASLANQPPSADDGLSAEIKLRLSLARLKAVQAHQNKFS